MKSRIPYFFNDSYKSECDYFHLLQTYVKRDKILHGLVLQSAERVSVWRTLSVMTNERGW